MGNVSRILKRMSADLGPELLFGKPDLKKSTARPESESKRLIEKMYQIGKFRPSDLPNATWNQWYEILKFSGLSTQRHILNKVFKYCHEGLTSVKLREKIGECLGRTEKIVL